jgi:hypothetical protein
MSEKTCCPKCGAEPTAEPNIGGAEWLCGAAADYESPNCLRRQLAAANATIASLTEQNETLADSLETAVKAREQAESQAAYLNEKNIKAELERDRLLAALSPDADKKEKQK